MIVTTPARLLKRLAATGELENGTDGELARRRELSLSYLRNRDLFPTGSQYKGAAEFLTRLTGLTFTVPEIRELLSLFPLARIRLAEGKLSAAVRRELANVIGEFFLGCRWPVSRDKLDRNTFLEVFRKQGEKMGLTRVAQSSQDLSPEERRARFALITNRDDS